MTEFLIRTFIRDHENIKDTKVRTSYGVLASVTGIICNVCLFAVKFLIGTMGNSVSICSDAFNNLSDAVSSAISLAGVKMAAKPADSDHPYGHGRIEYIAALIVAFLVLEVGFSFLKSSVSKILHPEALTTGILSLIVLILSIGVKLWLSFFNRKLGKKIDSKVMQATAADALGDVLATGATVLSLVLYMVFGWNIDGWIGLGVSCVVMWAGITICRDTLQPLIGEPASQEEVQEIRNFVEKYPGILGSHDLLVHHYGPSKTMATIHVEMDSRGTMEGAHRIIDRIEREAQNELGISMVIHIDPVNTKDPLVLKERRKIKRILRQLSPDVTMHDLHILDEDGICFLFFDITVPYSMKDEEILKIRQAAEEQLHEPDRKIECVITIDRE